MTLKIKDIAVIAKYTEHTIGEAPRPGQIYLPMTPIEREHMESRLFSSINFLMDEAHTSHTLNCKISGSNEVDFDYITRLSTHEFYFYTQEPLTLAEFESLQNKIFTKAATLPVGIQLSLGSFAVKTNNNRVMNVTPHITCGQLPKFNFLIKNFTSPIDVRYKETDKYGLERTLLVFDKRNANLPLPEIKLNGVSQLFTFDPLIRCTTPRGNPFLTIIEVCLDHYEGVARSHIDMMQSTGDLMTQSVSHLVISNSVNLVAENSYGTVMHVDPEHSFTTCKANTQQKQSPGNPEYFFGNDEVKIFDLNPTECITLANACKKLEDLKTAKMELEAANMVLAIEINSIAVARCFDTLESLKFGTKDHKMIEYITEQKEAFTYSTLEEREKLLSDLRTIIKDLSASKEIDYVRGIIADFRKNAGVFTIRMNKKANKIEHEMAQIPIQERRDFLKSKSAHKVMEALASRRKFTFDFLPDAKSYIEFREKFKDSIKAKNETDSDETPSPKNN